MSLFGRCGTFDDYDLMTLVRRSFEWTMPRSIQSVSTWCCVPPSRPQCNRIAVEFHQDRSDDDYREVSLPIYYKKKTIKTHSYQQQCFHLSFIFRLSSPYSRRSVPSGKSVAFYRSCYGTLGRYRKHVPHYTLGEEEVLKRRERERESNRRREWKSKRKRRKEEKRRNRRETERNKKRKRRKEKWKRREEKMRNYQLTLMKGWRHQIRKKNPIHYPLSLFV